METISKQDIEAFLDELEQALIRMRDKALGIEFRIPDFTDEERKILGALVRETLIEAAQAAQAAIPENLKEPLGPDLATRWADVYKRLIPEEQ